MLVYFTIKLVWYKTTVHLQICSFKIVHSKDLYTILNEKYLGTILNEHWSCITCNCTLKCKSQISITLILLAVLNLCKMLIILKKAVFLKQFLKILSRKGTLLEKSFNCYRYKYRNDSYIIICQGKLFMIICTFKICNKRLLL